MATVVEVQQSKPKVEGLTLKISAVDARDLMTYIKSYYEHRGYGRGYETNNGLYNLLKQGLDGKATPEYVF